MRVVVAGGTGFIGRALRAALEAAGHEAVVLSRSAGPGRVVWDGETQGPWTAALEGSGAVVNLAGASVAGGRWTEARKRLLAQSRLLPTRALVTALSGLKERPGVLVSASAVGYYGDRGDEELSERSGPGAGFLARLCVDWELEARKAAGYGARVVLLRTGIVLGKGGGALAKMLTPFRLGLGGPLGSGTQWMPWISLEDEVGLILHLLEREVSGPVNAAAPSPVTNQGFSAALGRALRRPALLRAPAFALRLALGEMSSLLLGGQKVRPEKALESGYRFKHPELAAALEACL